MDVNDKLRKILEDRNWTEYRLSKETGLSQATVGNVFRRNTMPSISTLERICDGLGITLSQFFAEDEMVELTPELKEIFELWRTLTIEQKEAMLQIARAMKNNR